MRGQVKSQFIIGARRTFALYLRGNRQGCSVLMLSQCRALTATVPGAAYATKHQLLGNFPSSDGFCGSSLRSILSRPKAVSKGAKNTVKRCKIAPPSTGSGLGFDTRSRCSRYSGCSTTENVRIRKKPERIGQIPCAYDARLYHQLEGVTRKQLPDLFKHVAGLGLLDALGYSGSTPSAGFFRLRPFPQALSDWRPGSA